MYCRPSCASRRARPENVAFHATRADAEREGFRPCKRCKPDEAALADQQAARITGICRFIETADEIPNLDALAERAGMSVYHFHRTFKAITGVTPKAYAQAHRATRVRAQLDSATRVTDAIYNAGYNSNARFYENADALLGMTPTDYRHGGTNARIRFAIGATSLGAILVARSERGVLRDHARRRSRYARARSAGQVPAGNIDRRATRTSNASWRASWGWSRRRNSGSTCRSTCAARHSSRRVWDALRRIPRRHNRELQRNRRTHRRAEGGTRG